MFMSKLRYLRNRLQRTGLIIRMHNCDEHSLFIDGCLNRLKTDTPTIVNGEISDAKPMQPFKCATGIEDGGMFCYLCNDMVTLIEISKSYTANCQVIAFRSPTSKSNLFRRTNKDLSYLRSCSVDGLVRSISITVRT